MKEKPLLIILTGCAGSGLGTSAKALEDLGFFCVDNLPFELVEITLDLLQNTVPKDKRGFAFAVHIYNSEEAKRFASVKEKLKRKAIVEIIFLTADHEILAVRFNATRRKHPYLGAGGREDLLSAIGHETKVLLPVEQAADCTIDTSAFSPHDLARLLEQRYHYDVLKRNLLVTLVSFGFKYGSCRSLDNLFDVRFLPNPYFVADLKDQNGMEKKVRDYVLESETAKQFLNKLVEWHSWLLLRYHEEGKNYLRIGVGCTGGVHRSVSIVEELAERLRSLSLANITLQVHHRDLKR